LRTTRSGVQFAPVDESILEKKEGNKKVDRNAKIEWYFNPEANRAVEKSRTFEEPPNTPTLQQNVLEATVEGDELGRDVTNVAINYLFGDLGFFCRDSFLKEPDIALYSDSKEYKNLKSKLSEFHILDALDF